MPITPIPPIAPAAPAVAAPVAQGTGASAGAGTGGFGQMLQQALSGLNSLETGADAAAGQLASGNSADLATAVIAAEKANMALQLAVEVRNRAITAYQQIMQMQI